MPLISNELEVALPLYLDEIRLPDPELRKLDKDFYDEYVEVVDYNEAPSKLNYFLFIRFSYEFLFFILFSFFSLSNSFTNAFRF